MVYFRLNKEFVNEYKERPSPFSTVLGEVVFYRTYSRLKEDGTKEDWTDTVERVVNGIYTYQKRHCKHFRLHWSEAKAQRSAQKMFDKIFNMKFLPPGRGLWMCGGKYVDDENCSTPMYNCAFVSTEGIRDEGTLPFTFGMNSLFLGVGLGFDTRGAGKMKIVKPHGEVEHEIDDCREAWTDSVEALLKSYFNGTRKPVFNYQRIRPAGMPLKRFGGYASGYGPLKELHDAIEKMLDERIGSYLTSVDIVDIFNLIGRCIVAGSIRRSAEIALGDEDDDAFLEMKDYNKFPEQVQQYRWMSNNSINAQIGKTDYQKILGHAGEVPGLFWLENAREYGRMVDGACNADPQVMGVNPCAEIPLESYEMCNLAEVFPSKHESFEEFQETLKFAYLYTKTITLLPTDSIHTNEVQMRNRRLGISVSGVTAAFNKHGMRDVVSWLDDGYKYLRELDTIYSKWFKTGTSIKLTTVKPSGSVSLLAAEPSGIHMPHSEYYIRRVRIGLHDPILTPLHEAGYNIEKEIAGGTESASLQRVVEFPIKEEYFSQSKDDVSVWQQVKLTALMQKYWADNAVSVTVTYKKDEQKDIPRIMEHFERDLKSISFLPLMDHGFAQAPLETITKEQYEEMTKNLKSVDFTDLKNDAIGVKYCDQEVCEL